MGQFDQAARSAVDLEPGYFLERITSLSQLSLQFRRWFDPRTVPLPGGPERTADLVAILEDPKKPESPWLFVCELQTRHEDSKPEVLLLETAIFACYAQDSDHQGGPFRVLPVFVYLSGVCPRPIVDHRTPSGKGLCCGPVIWELEKDSAPEELHKAENGEVSWDALFWTVLMNGGGADETLSAWRRLLDEKVPARRRADVAYIALELAELVGCLPALERVLEDVEMTESTIYNRTLAQGEARGRLQVQRGNLLMLLDGRFPGQIPDEYLDVVRKQESFPMLEAWYKAAVYAKNVDDFLLVMRK